MSTDQPLTTAHRDQILSCLRKLDSVDPLYERCERAGIDLGGFRANAEELRQWYVGVLREFFPDALNGSNGHEQPE